MLYSLKQVLLPFENTYQNVIIDKTEGSNGFSTLVNTLLLSPIHKSFVKDLSTLLNENIEIESDFIIAQLISIAKVFNPDNSINSEFLKSTLNQFIFNKTQLDPVFDGTFKVSDDISSLSNIELSIFQLYQLTVLHMWVTEDSFVAGKSLKDTQQIIVDGYSLKKSINANPELLSEGSKEKTLQQYNEVKSFLASSATQLTEFGLQTTKSKLNPKDIVVFYKNEKFQSLLKGLDGALYIFTPIVDSDLNWLSLTSVNGTGDNYFTTLQDVCGNSFGNNKEQQLSDEELAKQLQIKEDEEYADMLNKKSQKKANTTNNQKYIAKKEKHTTKNQKKAKLKSASKKCIIM
ncbi:hypothetical protein QEN19_000454 [Hanseniaspora menglaensis]